MAAFLACAAPIAVGYSRSAVSWRGAGGGLSTLAVAVVGVVLTYTRGSWIALAGGLGLMVILLRLWRWLVPLGLAAALAFLVAPPVIQDRALSIALFQEDPSASKRLVVWSNAIPLVLSRPIIGYGFHGFRLQYGDQIDFYHAMHTHNIILDFALAIGVPGTLCFLWVVGSVVRSAARSARRGLRHGAPTAPLLVGAVVGCLTMLAAGMTDGSVPIWPLLAHTFWFALGLTWATTQVVQGEVADPRRL